MVQTREVNKPGTSLHQAVALCGASPLRETRLSWLCAQETPWNTVSAPSSDYNANLPRGIHSDQEGLASPAGAGSPTQVWVLVKMSVNVLIVYPPGRERTSSRSRSTCWGWHWGLRRSSGDWRLFWHGGGCRRCHQHCPQHSLQRSTVQTLCWPTNNLQGSEQWGSDCESRFAQRCAQPVSPACSSLCWDIAGWGT